MQSGQDGNGDNAAHWVCTVCAGSGKPLSPPYQTTQSELGETAALAVFLFALFAERAFIATDPTATSTL